MIGRNINTNDVATVTRVPINSVTATIIAPVNPDRIHISVCLAYNTFDVDVMKVEEDVKRTLKEIHQISPEDDRAIGSFNLGEIFNKV